MAMRNLKRMGKIFVTVNGNIVNANAMHFFCVCMCMHCHNNIQVLVECNLFGFQV